MGGSLLRETELNTVKSGQNSCKGECAKKVKSGKYELRLKLLVSLLPSPSSSARVVPPVLTCSPSEEKGPGLIF